MKPISGSEQVEAENIKSVDVLILDGAEPSRENFDLICEEPLSINVGERLFSIIMRTPGDEKAHAAGFCLSEGVVDAKEDLKSIRYDKNVDPNTVSVQLKNDPAGDFFIKRGSVRLPGHGSFDGNDLGDARPDLNRAKRPGTLTLESARSCLSRLPLVQNLRKKTRASHGAAIFDATSSLICSAEDVGRHNAIDKAVGKLLLDGGIDDAFMMVLSSRISDELVQKAARAGIPVIVSVSRPTARAVDLGRSLGMTLATFIGDRFFVFSGENRIA